MPQRKNNIVLPVMAALALVLMFWLVFRDHSTEPVAASPSAKTSQAAETHPGIAVA